MTETPHAPLIAPAVPRFNVLGVGVSALTLSSARDRILSARGARNLGYVCVCTVHGISEAQSDPTFRRILNNSYLTTPDGMPSEWVMVTQLPSRSTTQTCVVSLDGKPELNRGTSALTCATISFAIAAA